MAKNKSPKTAAGVTVTKAHLHAAANLIQSNFHEGTPQAIVARMLALEEHICGKPVAVQASPAAPKAA